MQALLYSLVLVSCSSYGGGFSTFHGNNYNYHPYYHYYGRQYYPNLYIYPYSLQSNYYGQVPSIVYPPAPSLVTPYAQIVPTPAVPVVPTTPVPSSNDSSGSITIPPPQVVPGTSSTPQVAPAFPTPVQPQVQPTLPPPSLPQIEVPLIPPENPNPAVIPNVSLNQVTAVQTIVGKAVIYRGNFSTKLPVAKRGKVEFWPTKLYVFKGRIKQGQLPVNLHDSRLVTITQTKADGTFNLNLTPGVYTVFSLYNNKLYNNSLDAQGFYKTVTVTAGKKVNVLITNTAEVVK